MALQTYTKINTMYKRYIFDGKDCPNKDWTKFKNKIILGDFSNIEAGYLFDNQWEAYSKIDGTCSKIVYFPSTGKIVVGGKTDKANSQHGQFEYLQAIADRIQPQLQKMYPKEAARFAPIKGDGNKIQYFEVKGNVIGTAACELTYTKTEPNASNFYGVAIEEVPVYIYGEYFGAGIQKCGSRYIQNGNSFVVFDIQAQGWWVPKGVRDAICYALDLETVPYLGNMTLREIEDMVRGGFTTKFENAADPTMIEEGIVARPVIPICDGRGNRIIVKVKYCDYVEYDAVRKEFSDDEFTEFDKWYHENVEALNNELIK